MTSAAGRVLPSTIEANVRDRRGHLVVIAGDVFDGDRREMDRFVDSLSGDRM